MSWPRMSSEREDDAVEDDGVLVTTPSPSAKSGTSSSFAVEDASGGLPSVMRRPSAPSLVADEIDAPHIASLVEQFHGTWRRDGIRVKAAGFEQADRIPLDPQVYAPSNDDDVPIEATDEPSSETGASSAPPSTGESRSDDEEDEDEEDATKERNRGPGERPDVGALPLMQLCEPTYGADIRGVSTPSSPHRASIDADGARSVEHRFTVTVRAVSFEAGALERVEGHIALVDLGQNAFNTEHGVRGRISEDMHFAWN